MTVRHDAQLAASAKNRDCQLAHLATLPLDVLYLISDYSAVDDMVTLRDVAKPLRRLLNDPGIWRRMYKRNALFLPPGPYDWQSASYLINVLSRTKRLYSLWPVSSSCPKIRRTRSISFGRNAALSVLLGRWLLVAEGSTLVCYDSERSNVTDSAETLFNDDDGRRIHRVFSSGSVQEDGIKAFVVLLFDDSFTIAKVSMAQEKPSGLQIVLTSTPIVAKGWKDSVHVRLYHRLLVVNISACSSDEESSWRLVFLDIDTLHRYHIPVSTTDPEFDQLDTTTSYFATKAHLVRIIDAQSSHYNNTRMKVECFPLPTAHEIPESDILYPSHQSLVMYGVKLRQCTVVHESPMDSETGRMSFALCGINSLARGGTLDILEGFLEPDGSVSVLALELATIPTTSFCIGMNTRCGYGVALGRNKYPFAFALSYNGPGSFFFVYSALDHSFSKSELVDLDAFRGTAFFSCRSDRQTSVEIVDFIRDAYKTQILLPPGYVWWRQYGMMAESEMGVED